MGGNSLPSAHLDAYVNAWPIRIVAGERGSAAPSMPDGFLLGQIEMRFIDRRWMIGRSLQQVLIAVGAAWLAACAATSAPAADAAFQRWLADLWPQAQAMGVSRKTFDAATRGVEPDL